MGAIAPEFSLLSAVRAVDEEEKCLEMEARRGAVAEEEFKEVRRSSVLLLVLTPPLATDLIVALRPMNEEEEDDAVDSVS